MPSEHLIRDALAADLTVLEPGLTLVRTEYPLPNAEGTRGFIDLLARDRYDNFVVIELKRSNQAAGRAIHELFKYAELLAREKGLDATQVRCMLVSTVWDELLAPFSLVVRDFSYDTIGIAIEVDSAGHVMSAHPVVPLEEIPKHGLTPVQMFLMYWTAQDRDAAWQVVSVHLRDAGCPDHVGFILDRSPASDDVNYGIYLALGRTAPNPTLAEMAEEIPDDSVEAPAGCVWEYRALCLLMKEYRGAATAAVGYPDRLSHWVRESRTWDVKETMRAGRFTDQEDLVSDEDLLEQAGGFTGGSDVSFASRLTPQRPAHWNETRKKLNRCLVGNPDWEAIVNGWLDEVQTSCPTSEVAIALFNPCDVVGSIVNTITDEQADSMPTFELQLITDDEVQRTALGSLAWDPKATSSGLLDAFRDVYGDSIGWGIAHSFAETCALDLDLCERTGLRYAAFEFLPGDDPPVRLVSGSEGLLRVQVNGGEGDAGLQPLPAWLKANESDLHEITTELAASSIGLFPGLN